MSKTSKLFKLIGNLKGHPKKTDFQLANETVTSLKDGEYLTQAVYLQVAPFQLANKQGVTETEVSKGIQIAEILESKNENFPIGKYVIGDFGWRTLTVVNKGAFESFQPYLLPVEIGNLSITLALGALGIPGLAAYFGLLEICKPKENDVVVVSGASGSVGHLVGQIAKIKKCQVIGITSSNEKGEWLKNELGFDYYINYKSDDVKSKLQQYAPNGIDCYFDNVGGEVSSHVIYHMKTFGRICICGATSLYYNNESCKAPEVQTPIKIKHVKMEGMHVSRWTNCWSEGIAQNLEWIKEGKLKCKETITEGFENTVEAFMGTLESKNCGTVLVKIN